ncbi:MAG: S9 family peptidase [Phycisphaerae bacterium]|jgi:dipeptidyl aminopeptidase/acylaminoacyl peptidase
METSTAETHPFSIHDMLAMKRISDQRVSPDGRWIVFDLKVIDLEENKGVSDLWLVRTDGTDLRQLTSHPSGSSSPRWSPDNKSILFLSKRTETSQVWRIPLDGGEARQVTDEPLNVANLVVSPDGNHIAFSIEVFPGLSPEQTKEKLDEREKSKATGRLHQRLFIRHWDTWKDGRRSHLFVLPIRDPTGNAPFGEAVDVMKDMDADVPSKPFGSSDEITFAPDGQSVIFCARNVGRQEAWSTRFDLYQAPLDASRPPQCLTEGNRAAITRPVFSPDGNTLAYLSMERPGYEADRWRILLRAWPNGETRVLTHDWDRSATTIVWSRDGTTIYAVADNIGQRSLFAVDVNSGEVRTLVRDGKAGTPLAASLSGEPADEHIVFGLCHHRSPVELHTVRPDGSDLKRITSINDKHLASVRMGDSEQFAFPGWNEEEVYAYVVKPVDFDASKTYPVAFLIHGGPQGSFGNDFHYRWNPQAYAGAGYAVIMVDFHGSTGYGQSFCDSIRGDWGGKPFVDLQKGLAAALDRYPWMDPDRVAALGASFGGYMINWIAGNWPDRFRCLVNHDGNLDERMAYYDTEELWFPEWDHQGNPWDNPENFAKHNPIDFVKNWKTPMLVIHGARDFRVVDVQGIATFTALQRRAIPSKLLYFPDENHWVLKPANSIQWHETVIAWIDQWTKPLSG